MNNNKELFGLIGKDLPDERDVLLSSVVPLKTDYPAIIDFDRHTIISRQNWGSCTSHSATGTAEHQESEEYQKKTNLASKFVYIKTKVISGLYNIEGDYLRNAMKALERYGVPFEEDFPDLGLGNWNDYVHTPISPEIEEKALTHKTKGYASIGYGIEDFMSGMWTSKSPVSTGMMWYESYGKIKNDGYLPPADGKEKGGHAIRVVKIDQKEQKVWFANSWGTIWGNNGYYYIPFNEWSLHKIWSCWVVHPLPNDWRDKVKNMHQRFIKNDEQYFKHNGIYWHIPDSETLHFLLDRLWVTEGMQPLPNDAEIKEMPLSVKAYEYIKRGKEVFDDLFSI